MLDSLLEMFKDEISPLGHMGNLLKDLSELIEYFSEDYLKDPNAKNAAIDAVCQLLQEQKTKK